MKKAKFNEEPMAIGSPLTNQSSDKKVTHKPSIIQPKYDKMIKKYLQSVEKIKKYATCRMGHPYTGPVNGYFTENHWELDPSSPNRLIDYSVLGIKPGSIADTYMNNSGSPYTKSKIIQRDVKNIEIEIINMLAQFYGQFPHNLRGYITTGATEANLSSLWWLRESLQQQNNEEIYVILSNHSHYSLYKACHILGLKVIEIPVINNGFVDVSALIKQVEFIVTKKPKSKIIISMNIGTTEFGAIDDISSVYNNLKQLQAKKTFDFRIHADAALLGLTIPYLKSIGNKSIFEYVDTFIFSGHKFLGTLSISGVVLTKANIWDTAFKKHSKTVEYVLGIEDITILGSRSGFAVIEFHHALCSLDINTNSSRLHKLINTCLFHTEFLAKQLTQIVPADSITVHPNQFTVTFPSVGINTQTLPFLKKYGLMKVRNHRLGICVLAHVNRSLIESFLIEYKTYIGSVTELSFQKTIAT